MNSNFGCFQTALLYAHVSRLVGFSTVPSSWTSNVFVVVSCTWQRLEDFSFTKVRETISCSIFAVKFVHQWTALSCAVHQSFAHVVESASLRSIIWNTDGLGDSSVGKIKSVSSSASHKIILYSSLSIVLVHLTQFCQSSAKQISFLSLSDEMSSCSTESTLHMTRLHLMSGILSGKDRSVYSVPHKDESISGTIASVYVPPE